MKRVAASGTACMMALTVLAGCGGSTKKVAVRINKDTITEDEFYKRVQDVSLADLAPAAQGRGPAKAGEYAMEHIVIESLLQQLGDQKGVKPTAAEIDRYVAVAKKYQQNSTLSLLTPNPFRTEDDYKREAKLALIQRGLAIAPLKMTQDEIKKKYEEYKSRLTPEDQYHLRVIQVNSAEKAQKALDALKKGVAFETVALTQSEEPNSKAKSGDIGIVPQGGLPPQFLAAIKDLKPNEYTKSAVRMGAQPAAGQPAPSSQFLIVQVVEKLPGMPPSVEEATYIIERYLLNEKDPNFAQRIQGDLMNVRKTADIQVNLEQYKKLAEQIKTAAAPPSPAMPAPSAPVGPGGPGR